MSLISMHESSNHTLTYNVETVMKLSVGAASTVKVNLIKSPPHSPDD